MEDLLVVADDRTGALETAGALAARLRAGVSVGVGGAQVIDLGTRHLAPADAVAAWARLERPPTAVKIDSTLRGAWAAEVLAVVRRGRRALVVAALPALGRTCEDGVVRVDGVPVAATAAAHDPRHPVRWSRPGDHLVAAGAASHEVVHLADDDELAGWLAERAAPPLAVVDAAADDDLERIGRRWRAAPSAPLLVGTSAAVAAGLGPPGVERPAAPPRAAAVLVVCGSLHPAARRQVAALLRRPDPDDRVVVLTSEPLADGATAGEGTAAALALVARHAAAARSGRVLVVVGGDTAAAVLGDETVTVRGMLGQGAVWAVRADGATIVTRAGGFGSDDALVQLVDALLDATDAGTLCG